MYRYLLIVPFLIGCTSSKKQNDYQKLIDYEGHYEYLGETTLNLVVSELDTTLYAVIDNSKYPLKHIKKDSFTNVRDKPVVFNRDNGGAVISYSSGGQTFNLLNKEFESIETLPRRSLLHDPDEYTYQKPLQKNDGLKTGNLYDEFNNPEPIIEMVKETIKGNYPEVHSILIYKNDRLVLEEYFYGYNADTPHQLRSANKAILSGIIGIAVDKGFINSEKDRLLPYFNNIYKTIQNKDALKEKITVENFLTYRHGMDCENNNPNSEGNEMRMMQSSDWVKHTLDLPMVETPGASASYCSGCPLTLGRLLEIATKERIEDFAKKHLFDPMGISNYRYTFNPKPSSKTNFNQMYMTPRNMVKLAKLYKDDGQWNGQQILSKSWVNKTFNMDKGSYGYFWEHKYFIIDGKQYDSYLASGNGGQKINIWPELDMITIFTGGNYNAYELYGTSTPPNEMIPKYILKALN